MSTTPMVTQTYLQEGLTRFRGTTDKDQLLLQAGSSSSQQTSLSAQMQSLCKICCLTVAEVLEHTGTIQCVRS